MKTPSKHPKIFLYGYYGFGNLGDDLLLQSAIDGIRQHWPNAQFTLRNRDNISAIKAYGTSVKLSNCDQALEEKGSRLVRLGRYLRTVFTAMKDHDVFVFGGGTLWHTNPTILSLLIVCLVMLCARMRGLQIVAIGLGVGPTKGLLAKIILRSMITMSTQICVRDQKSKKNLSSTASHIKETADLVYASRLANTLRQNVKTMEKRKTIAVSIAAHHLGPTPNTLATHLATVLSPVLTDGMRLRIMIFQDTAGNSDTPFAEKLYQAFPSPLRSLISIESLTPDASAILKAFKGVELHIGMRFHGIVLASLLEIPFIGLSSDHKVHMLAEYFGLPYFTHESAQNSMQTEDILSAINYVYAPSLLNQLAAAAHNNYTWFSETHTS